MNTLIQPRNSSAVEIIEIGWCPVEDDLGQERFLELAEGPLDFAFAFRVARLARRDLRPVMSGELDRWRVQLEPSALRTTQRSHPIRATHLWDTPDSVEEPGDPLESVMSIL